MNIVILCTVPDEWRDNTHVTGILPMPFNDIEAALRNVGAEDIDTRPYVTLKDLEGDL